MKKDKNGLLIKNGNVALMPTPNSTDLHLNEFQGIVTSTEGKYITVQDNEGDSFQIEANRLVVVDGQRINKGDFVERLGPPKDYTTGRRGTVLEIAGDRARVNWTHHQVRDRDGKKTDEYTPMQPIRTWVNFKALSDPIKP